MIIKYLKFIIILKYYIINGFTIISEAKKLKDKAKQLKDKDLQSVNNTKKDALNKVTNDTIQAVSNLNKSGGKKSKTNKKLKSSKKSKSKKLGVKNKNSKKSKASQKSKKSKKSKGSEKRKSSIQ